jgi:hypothetical protein
MLGLGPSGAVSLGVMLYWAIAWGSVRTGAWWAFVPPTLMLTMISFSLLLLQSSLDELFNPRLRRGKINKKKKGAATRFEIPAAEGPAPQLTAAGVVEGPAPVEDVRGPRRRGLGGPAHRAVDADQDGLGERRADVQAQDCASRHCGRLVVGMRRANPS